MNAVFERDFVRLSTAKRFLWMRAGLALAVASIAGIRLLGAYAEDDFAGIGAFVLGISIWTGLLLLLVATPGSYATVLVHARAQNTLAVLLSTPLTPFQLAWGAFVARAGTLTVFVLATLPPIALGIAFGGIQVEQILAAACSVLAAMLLVAAPAFVISAFARRTGAAVVSSYLCAATVLTALAAIGSAIAGGAGGTPGASAAAAAAVSPIHGVIAALDPLAPSGAVLASSALLLLGAILLSAAAILVATQRLRADAVGGLEQTTRIAEGRPPRAMRYKNPILDRELALGADRSRGAGRTLLLVLVLTQVAYFTAIWATGEKTSLPIFSGFLIFEVALLLLAAAAAGSTCLAAEKESGALDLIRATPISAADIVQGKLAGVLRAQLPCLAVPLVHLGWGVFARDPQGNAILSPLAIPYVAVAGAIVVSTWTITGMSQSLDQRDPHRAVVRTMAALGITGVIIAAQVGIVLWKVLPESDPYLRGTIAFGANPVGAVLGGAAIFRTGGTTLEATSLPKPSEAYVSGAIVASALWLGLHVIAGLVIHRKLVSLYRTRFEG